MARAVLLELTAVLQADAVVARRDVTVGDAHVFRVVEVNAVAVADLQVVQQLDAVDDSLVATDEVNRPVGTLTDGHVADGQPAHVRQRQYMGTGIESLVGQGLQFVGVFEFGTHKGDAVAVDGALARDADVVGIVGIEPEHTLTLVLAEGTQVIDALVGIGLERGRSLQMEFHVALQFNGASHKDMITGQEHTPAALLTTTVDGLLDGYRIVSDAVTLGTEGRHIIHCLRRNCRDDKCQKCPQ